MSGGRVLGVDACRAGWVGIALPGRADLPGRAHLPGGADLPGEMASPSEMASPGGPDLSCGAARAYFAPGIRELADRAAADGPVTVIAIDIPIGLADTGRRGADVLARKELKERWPSLFITPVRAAVEAADYQAASAENRRLAGEGLSRQAFALRAKILDVDRWLRAGSPPPARVVEVHPELSFAAMAGAPLRSRKITWAGAVQRRTLLAEAGIVLDGDLGLAGAQAGVDDVLDAAAAAWTARRVSQGCARCLPPSPEVFSDGIASAIWT